MRKKSVLIVLVILAICLVGTGLSTLYRQDEYTGGFFTKGMFKVSYGFPLGWHGYSQIFVGIPAFSPLPEIYWFSLVSLLLDAAFWIALSFFVTQGLIATMKAVNILRRAKASKKLSVINI